MRSFILIVVFFVLTLTLIIGSVNMRVDAMPGDSPTIALTDFDIKSKYIEKKTLTLPANFNIPRRTGFTLETDIPPGQYESIMIKTVFTDLKLYADDELIYDSDYSGAIPAWLIEHPTQLLIINVPEEASHLLFQYVSPSQRSSVSLPVVYAGGKAGLMLHLFYKNGVLLLLSVFMILTGFVLVIVGLSFFRKQTEKSIFIWPGLTMLAFGFWGFGECEASLIIFPFPAMLYCMAYAGMFSAAIPLLHFGLVVLRPRKPQLMISAIIVLYVILLVSLSLQIAGVVALSLSMYAFFVVAPVGIGFFTFTIFWEGYRYKNQLARSFAPPGIVLLAAALLELANYYYRFTDMLSFFALSGILIFVIMLMIIGVRYLRVTVHNAAEKKRLEDQVEFINRQLAIQQEQYSGITESVEQAKKARHDLRHQLSVLQGFNEVNDRDGQREYIDELIANIPTAYEKTICENFAVNAVAAHYIAIAELEGIEVETDVSIPENTGTIPALDLCIIVGNFLENALDACRRMKEGKKYIRIRSRIDGDTISIVVTNSYDGVWTEKSGIYLSRKESKSIREGVGLTSVKAVCEKHRGLVKIEAGKDYWKSSALIHF